MSNELRKQIDREILILNNRTVYDLYIDEMSELSDIQRGRLKRGEKINIPRSFSFETQYKIIKTS